MGAWEVGRELDLSVSLVEPFVGVWQSERQRKGPAQESEYGTARCTPPFSHQRPLWPSFAPQSLHL